MKAIAIALVAAGIAFAGSAEGRETKTEIGKWKSHSGGSVSFSVTDTDGRKSAAIFVSDKHIIETNYFSMSKGDLEKLKALIDETILELDGGAK